MMARNAERAGEAGFTLIEALVALALTGLVMSALATITAQYLPSWNRGIDRIQHSELIGISMQRIAADLAAAEFIPAGSEDNNDKKKKPLFEGTPLSVTFVRTAIGPNAGIGLDVVRIGETTDRGRIVTARTRTGFTPLPQGAAPSQQLRLTDPVVLLRAPLRLTFAYADSDKVFHDDWHDADKLPVAIRLTVRDTTSEHVLAVSTVTPVHVDTPAGKSDDGVGNNKNGAPDNNPDNDGGNAVGGSGKRGGS
ncbi:MAG TPA: prepilin-type N-terminal cleavage/methylation domain-containing protein [Bradyrhizobium sp.]|nr:prepilin-type N-terminal cleavage/methylation domain-containing protein [Bradyrhizobium sp.]